MRVTSIASGRACAPQVAETIIPTNNHTMYALIVTRICFNPLSKIDYDCGDKEIGSQDEMQVA